MPQPAMLYYVIENEIGISKGASALIVLVSDGHSAKRAELKVASTQDSLVQIQTRINQLWNTGEAATMQEYRAAVQRAENPLIATLVDAIAVVITTSATPAVADVFTAAEGVIAPGSPRHDEWVKLENMLKAMTRDEQSRFMGLLSLILFAKAQQ